MVSVDLASLRKHLPALCVFITPVLLVKVAALTIGSPQRPVEVTHVQPVFVQTTHVTQQRQPTEAERAAAMRVAHLRSTRLGDSPLYYAGSTAAYVPEPAIVYEEPVVDDSLNVIVRAVMSLRDPATGVSSSIAFINGKQRRIGDVLAQWEIIDISTDDRTVAFKHLETGERESRAVLGP
jgi:hypothetical protein